MRLKGKVVVVTGAGSGIGKVCAIHLAGEGADIVVSDIDPETARRTAEEVKAQGVRAISVKADVTQLGDVRSMYRKAENELGRIDVLVNNAGVRYMSSISNLDIEEWNKTININLTGKFLCLQQIVPAFLRQGAGKIVNIASVSGLVGYSNRAAYCASKAGVLGLTRAAAAELGKVNIQVNAVAPGFSVTPLTDYPADIVTKMVERVPAGRRATSIDTARAVAYLASADADYVTGATLVVDGGMTSSLIVDAAPWKVQYASADDHWD
jgi:3-oxoacyl-[acyl-carrier protein] reductase